MSLSILGLGLARPPFAMTQTDSADAAIASNALPAGRARVLRTLYQKTSVRHRGSVLLGAGKSNGSPTLCPDTVSRMTGFYPAGKPDDGRGPGVGQRMERYVEQATPLAAAAIRLALEQANIKAAEVEHLITVSCTGFAAPGVDIKLIEQLGMRPTVQRSLIGFMGCHGALNGLRVAGALAAANPGNAVLLCCVELCSLHFQYGWEPNRVVANALFADGAAAVAGRSTSSAEAWRVEAHGSCLLPDSTGDMTWTIGDHGFEMTLSPRVPQRIADHLKPWLEKWLAGQELTVDQVGSWVIHPGGPRVVSSVGEALGLDHAATEPSRAVLAECGNMSSPTVLFILDRLRRRDAPRPCVMLAFGPGLTAEAALLR